MTVENLAEVQAYLEAQKGNAEVKTYMDSFKVLPTLEVFKGLTNTNAEYKSFMDSEKDKHSTKGLETWKSNNLDALVSAKVKELHPDADPRDTAMNTLKAELAQMKADGQHKELTIKASKLMQEKKLPLELLDLLIGADETITISNLTALEKVFKTHVEVLVAERLKGGYVPPVGTPALGTKNPFKPGVDYNLTEQGKMYKENPELAKTLMANI